MRLLSINVAKVQEVEIDGKLVRTGIFKKPVHGPVRLHKLGLDGDEQGNPASHGGPEMPAYCYAASSYDYWRRELPHMEVPYGKLGENLTIEGFDDDSVHIGDIFRIGTGERSALVQTSLPRAPCAKLGKTMDSPEFVKVFLHSLRLGWYVRVLHEGVIEAGDPVVREHVHPAKLSITEIARLRFFSTTDIDAARRAADIEELAPKWRTHFRARVEAAQRT